MRLETGVEPMLAVTDCPQPQGRRLGARVHAQAPMGLPGASTHLGWAGQGLLRCCAHSGLVR